LEHLAQTRLGKKPSVTNVLPSTKHMREHSKSENKKSSVGGKDRLGRMPTSDAPLETILQQVTHSGKSGPKH